MTYIPKFEAAKTIDEVHRYINTAQLQWNTYATILGRGYTEAYQKHKATLNDMKEKEQSDKEFAYFLLSTLCVGFAGGLAGGLMAPWIRDAATVEVGVFREIIRETTKTGLKKGYEEMARDFIDSASQKGVYSPAGKDPLIYQDDLIIELGLFFSLIRDEVEKDVIEADKETGFSNTGPPLEWGIKRRDAWINIPNIRDHPQKGQFPDKDYVARIAEISLWIAWANNYNLSDYRRISKGLEDGVTNSNYESLSAKIASKLEPVVYRLIELGVAHHVTTVVKDKIDGWHPSYHGLDGYKRVLFLNIPKLQTLGQKLGGYFFNNIDKVVNSSSLANTTLSSLASVPPIFKRGNKNRLPVAPPKATVGR